MICGRDLEKAVKKKTPKKPPWYTRAKITDDEATIYRILREEFTAADLQKYTEIETMIPFEKVLGDLDKFISKQSKSKRKKA
jgi:hypothetical protein